jgi:YlmC/YmxH family sporulation protein
MVMKEYSFLELRDKQVVNVAEGRNLGRIFDLCFTCTGQVTGLVVACRRGLWKNFVSGDGLFIPWRNIIKIGADIILVELIGNCGILGTEDTECEPCDK